MDKELANMHYPNCLFNKPTKKELKITLCMRA